MYGSVRTIKVQAQLENQGTATQNTYLESVLSGDCGCIDVSGRGARLIIAYMGRACVTYMCLNFSSKLFQVNTVFVLQMPYFASKDI
jgi:hypothetical protein